MKRACETEMERLYPQAKAVNPSGTVLASCLWGRNLVSGVRYHGPEGLYYRGRIEKHL